MGIVSEKPQDVPSSNDLDKLDIDTESGLSIDAYVGFGATPKALPNPPKIGDVVTYLVKAECVCDGRARRADGEMRYSRKMSIISVWKPGETEPVTDSDQGELFDGDGNPADDEDGNE
jgi:hypothetical protein